MIHHVLLIAAVSSSLIATALAQQSDFFCETCDKVLVLNKEDRACLAKKIDGYLDEAKQTNPVLIVLVGCNGTPRSLDDSTKLPNDPDIGEIGDPDAPATAAPNIFFLTARQLTCLNAHLPRLVDDPSDRVTFDFVACPAP